MGLLGRLARRESSQHMPYATSELSRLCVQCESRPCLVSCPEQVIVLNPDDLPTLDFSSSGCVFCGECVNACFGERGGHMGFDEGRLSTGFSMRINPTTCLAWNQAICYSCKDVCPCEIGFGRGMFCPEILSCSGCGLCVSRCPSNAIEF